MAWHSSGVDNDELASNLARNRIFTDQKLLAAFRCVDRRDFVPDAVKHRAYKDSPLKEGNVHLSAPHIYGSVLEALDIKEGLSFLNVGSGSGYLSALVGILLGPNGTNHGIELYSDVVSHARASQEAHLQAIAAKRADSLGCNLTHEPMEDDEDEAEMSDSAVDQDSNSLSHANSNGNGHGHESRNENGNDTTSSRFLSRAAQYKALLARNPCPAEFVKGDAFLIDVKNHMKYDRIYVGANAPQEYLTEIRQLLRPGGILVGPFDDSLLKVRKEAEGVYPTDVKCQVSFAGLVKSIGDQNSSKEVYFRTPVWSAATHVRYPDSFHRGINAYLLCHNRHDSILSTLPQSLVLTIISYVPQMHAVHGANFHGSPSAYTGLSRYIALHPFTLYNPLELFWPLCHSYMNADWFVPPPDPQQRLVTLLKAEISAREAAERRAQKAESERDSYKILVWRQQQRIHRLLHQIHEQEGTMNHHRRDVVIVAPPLESSDDGGSSSDDEDIHTRAADAMSISSSPHRNISAPPAF